MSIVFNLYKDWNADIKQKAADSAKAESDSLLRASQEKILLLQNSMRDTIVKKVENTYENSIKASNDALAKYNLKITDSLHSVVNKLKLDATKPQLSLAPLEKNKRHFFLTKEDDKNILVIQFISDDGTSYNISLSCYLLADSGGYNFTILASQVLSVGESFLIKDVTRSSKIYIPEDILSRSKVAVYITGSFTKDPEGKYIIPFDYAFDYNFKEDKYITGLMLSFNRLKRQLNIP